MTPIIFDGPIEKIPEGFNAIVIPLDGRMSSDLNWKLEDGIAEEAVEKGLSLFWDMDLGLFDRLDHPLTHETQLKSLSLALDHFYQSLWPKFGDKTQGIAFYRGSIDMRLSFMEDGFKDWLGGRPESPQLRRLYCRDVALEYLHMLLPSLPQTVDPFVLLDASEIRDPLELAQLLDNDRYDRIKRAIKGSLVPHREVQWGECGYSLDFKGFLGTENSFKKGGPAKVGVYLPYTETYEEDHWNDLRLALNSLKGPYRLVSEEQLVGDWDGLDSIIVSEAGVTPLGKRKLLGFCAAGGTIVTINGVCLGMPQEISLKSWLSER